MKRMYYWYDRKTGRRFELICTVTYERYNIGVANVRWFVYSLPVLIACIREPDMVSIINDLGRVYDGRGFTDVIRWSDIPSEKPLTERHDYAILNTDGESIPHLRVVEMETDNGNSGNQQDSAAIDGATEYTS